MPSPILLVAAAALFSLPQSGRKLEPPPGMVLVEGGQTKVGATEEEVIAMIGSDSQGRTTPWVAQYPQYKTRVGDFFLGVTEVTNEQYHEYVKATGAKPPEHWATRAIDEGQTAYNLAQAEIKKAKKEKGDDYKIPPFERAPWWRDNWKTASWEFPEELALHPVVFIDYQEAQAYARWAGVRLPTEEEFQRACRGDGDDPYPWGSDWTPGKYANTIETGSTKTTPAGTYPAGARNGVYDLAGSVWEWTSSPYAGYPKYAPLKLKKKDKSIQSIVVDFNPNNRVAVGGSFQQPREECRITVRRNAERYQSTGALGFRVAASVAPGIDMAETVMREDVPVHARPEDVSYDALNAIALDFWRSRAPAPPTQDAKDAKDAKDPKDDAPKEAKGSPGPSIPNYAAITGYDYLLFIPVEKVAEHNVKAVDEKSVGNGPIHLGVLATNQDLLEPALPAGAYFVAYRGAGEVPKKKEQPVGAEGEAVDSGNAALAATAQEPVVEVPDIVAELGFDPLKEHLIFYDNMGTAVLAMPTPQLGFGRLQPGRVSVDKVRFTPEQLEKNPKLVPGDVAVLDFVLRSNSASRGFEMNLRAKLRPGATEGWRY